MKGFSLIELMVSMTILFIVSGGGLLYLNNFSIKQKLNKSLSEVKSMIELSSNYAKVKQSPVGDDTELVYISLTKSVSGNIEATINGVGTSYFSNNLTDFGVSVDFTPPIIYFWGGSGKLSSDGNGTFYGPNQTASVTITLNQDIAESRTIVINSQGAVE